MSVIDMFNSEPSYIANEKLDSGGRVSFDIRISKAKFTSLKIGKIVTTIYLEPGYDLKVSIEDQDGELMTYFGNGAKINNYLIQASLMQNKFMELKSKNIYELNEQDFLSRYDSMAKALNYFYISFNDSVKFTTDAQILLKKTNKIRLLTVKQIYGWNYGTRNNYLIPRKFDISSEIPSDSTLLNSHMVEYATMLQMNMHIKFINPLFVDKNTDEVELIRKNAPILIQEKIRGANYPTFMNEFLQAKTIDLCLRSGRTPVLDSVYNDFKLRYPNSKYLTPLEKHYDKWLAISYGRLAPDFTGYDLSNSPVSLTEFKRKVVYVDVWATWCGPCIDELPFAKEIQKKFASDEIVFLNVSIDKDREVWRKFLERETDFKGTHIIEVAGKSTPIRESYLISGIPTYILIDEKGTIISSNAPRPSSKEIIDILNGLLGKTSR
jgi:thiol-disulfide isomerase/thioredoxin